METPASLRDVGEGRLTARGEGRRRGSRSSLGARLENRLRKRLRRCHTHSRSVKGDASFSARRRRPRRDGDAARRERLSGCPGPSSWRSPRPVQGRAEEVGRRARRRARQLRGAVRSRRRGRDRPRRALGRSRPARRRGARGRASTSSSRSPARRRWPSTTRCGWSARRVPARSFRSATCAATTQASWRRTAASQAGEGGDPLVILLTSRDTGVAARARTRTTPAASCSTWRRTTTTRPAGSSATSPSRSRSHGRRSSIRCSQALGDLDNGVVTIRFARGGIASHARVADVAVRSRHPLRGRGKRRLGLRPGPGDGTADVIDRSDAARFPADYRARFADAYVAELAAFVAA